MTRTAADLGRELSSGLSVLRSQAGRAFGCARAGLLWLVLGICLAFVAPKVGAAALIYVAGLVVFVSGAIHLRAAGLETRFALEVRRYLSRHWNASPRPGLAYLLRAGRRRLRTAVAGWALAAIVVLLVVPIGLTYEVPTTLRIYGIALALAALRLQHMATVDRRLLREIDQHVRDFARQNVIAA